MDFYKSKIIPGDFDKTCEKINIAFFNSGFRFLIENNLQNQFKLELGITTNKCKILGAADFPIDLMQLNPFDSQGSIIYFKLMIFEINKNLLKINAIEPIFDSRYLLNNRFNIVLRKVKVRISKMIDLIINIQHLNYQEEKHKSLIINNYFNFNDFIKTLG